MLETLRIQNFALIDTVEVEFRAGFNALTGETGAGKSIIVGALNLVLGARASADVLRKGAERATVDACFHLKNPGRRLVQLLEQHEIALEDGTLLLSRVVGADGRSKAYAGGKMVPVAVLAEIGDELVDLHGQHEHQSLLKGERQLELLDGFAGTSAIAETLRAQVGELRAMERMVEQLAADDRDRTRQLEFLRFEVDEIDAAAITPNEDEELKTRLSLISNAERIYTLANEAYALLYDSDETSTTDTLNGAVHALQALAAISPQFEALARQAQEAQATIEALAAEVREHTEQVEYDPQELDELNRRSVFLRDLKRKYGNSLEAVLAYRAKAAEELGNYENRDVRLASLRKQHAEQRDSAMAVATALSEKRRAAARKLDKQVTATLQDLGMRGARFQTELESCDLGGSGIDKVTFLLAANTGEDMKPLRQVASGGEVSRIMLALKSVFASADTIPTLIFDEIDAGVGGAVARNVAAQLRALAKSHQVLCITHIPQIAAVACAHFNVAKQSAKGRTTTTVVRIDDDARVQEIARLLDGTVSEVSLEHARVLLAVET